MILKHVVWNKFRWHQCWETRCAGPPDLWGEGTNDLLYFGRSVNLIKIRGEGYAHYSTIHRRPPGILDLLMAPMWRGKVWICRLMVIGHQSISISQEGKYIFYLVKLAKKLETLTDCFLLLQYILNRIESNQFIPEFFLHDIVW